MRKIKRILSTILLSSVLSVVAQTDFYDVSGFSLPVEYDTEGNVKYLLEGDSAKIYKNGLVEIEGLQLAFFDVGLLQFTINATNCVYNKYTKIAKSQTNLIIRGAQEEFVITGKEFAWDAGSERFGIYQQVRVEIAGGLGGKSETTLSPPPDQEQNFRQETTMKTSGKDNE